MSGVLPQERAGPRIPGAEDLVGGRGHEQVTLGCRMSEQRSNRVLKHR
jgi:hypothetical protein